MSSYWLQVQKMQERLRFPCFQRNKKKHCVYTMVFEEKSRETSRDRNRLVDQVGIRILPGGHRKER